MGGLGPGIGGFEYLIIGLVALLVLGPERLPVVLRQIGRIVAKARGMANEFRASFDDMARQSELDDLRREVEALRHGQSSVRLGAEADAAFADIRSGLEGPIEGPTPLPQAAVMEPLAAPEAEAEAAPAPAPKPKAPRKPAARKPKTAEAKPAKPRAPRKKKAADQ